MIQLVINNIMADLGDDTVVALNYENTDLTQPSAVKTSYSKSIELKGTPTNNAIFGSICEMTRNIVESEEVYTGVNFDPKKQTPATILENNEIVDNGYICLDKVTISNHNDITYSVTFYSKLGQFFYSLGYEEDTDDERKMSDLHWGFYDSETGNITTKEEEDKDYLIDWNEDFIESSWNDMDVDEEKPPFTIVDGEVRYTIGQTITASPVYNGTYDDFDNDTVLFFDEDGTTINKFATSGPQGYSNRNNSRNWFKLQGTRDFVEWEMNNLRASKQRPALNVQAFLTAISRPENNGGYTIDWKYVMDIENNKYYSDILKWGYIIGKPFDFNDTDELPKQAVTLFKNESYTGGGYLDMPNVSNYTIHNTSGGSVFSLSADDTTTVHLKLKPYFYAPSTNRTDYFYTYKSELKYKKYCNVIYQYFGLWGFNVSYTYIDTDGTTKSGCSPLFLYNTMGDNFDYDFKIDKINYFKEKYSGLFEKGYDFYDIKLKGVGSDYQVQFETGDIQVEFKIPENTTEISNVKINTFYLQGGQYSKAMPIGTEMMSSSYNPNPYKYEDIKDGDTYADTYQEALLHNNGVDYKWTEGMIIVNSDSTPTSYVYQGLVNPTIEASRINKKFLFGSFPNPYEMLMMITKPLNLRYIVDPYMKKVTIVPKYLYYLPEVKRYDDRIDYSQKIEIKPNVNESRYYRYGFKELETYAYNLFKKRNGNKEYGVKKINTGYSFNNDTNDVFENIDLDNVIPYQLKSQYFYRYLDTNRYKTPTIFNSPTVDFTYWTKNDEGELEDETTTEYGWSTFWDIAPSKVFDSRHRLCLFDSDNGNVEGDYILAYRGHRDNSNQVLVSHTIPIENELNDNPCYVMGTYVGNNEAMAYTSLSSLNYSQYGKWLSPMPFSLYYIPLGSNIVEESLEFMKPSQTFVQDDIIYPDDITVFDKYWRGLVDDEYDKNVKEIELYCFLDRRPKDAMRYFYYFMGCLWTLLKVTDYQISQNKPVKCKFLKVKSINNYINLYDTEAQSEQITEAEKQTLYFGTISNYSV